MSGRLVKCQCRDEYHQSSRSRRKQGDILTTGLSEIRDMREHMSQNTDRQPERAWTAGSRNCLATLGQGRTNNGRRDNNKWHWPAREIKNTNHTRPQVRWRARRRKEQNNRASIGRESCGDKLVQFLIRLAWKLCLLMHFKDTDTVFHDHFESRHGEPRHPVCDAHAGTLSIDDGCHRDTSFVLKVGGDELVSCLPMGTTSFPVWRSSQGLA